MKFSIKSIFFILPCVYLLCATTPIQAQTRFVDIEAECLYPRGTYQNGDKGILRYNGINHGPDNLHTADSAWYTLDTYIDGVKNETIYQGPLRVPYNIVAGDKFQYRDNYSILLYYPDITAPLEIQFCVKFINHHITQSGKPIYFSHKDTVTANDSCCNMLTILPTMATSISSSQKGEKGFLNIYPNPSNGKFDLVVDWLMANEKKMLLSVYDLNGRKIHESFLNSNGANASIVSIDLGHNVTKGLYALHLQGAREHITKSIVVR